MLTYFTQRKMQLKSVLIGVLLNLIVISGLPGQHLNIRIFNAQDGLIQSQVQTILQDKDGYLWFGTVNGASRYDGHEFYTFTVNDSLAENYIYSGLKDQDGNLWFGHNHNLVSRYDWKDKTFTQLLLKGKNNEKYPSKITKIFTDSAKRIWFVTDNDGVYYLENDSLRHISKSDGLSLNKIVDMCQIDKDTYWIASQLNIYVYKLQSGISDSLTVKKELPEINILSLLNDGEGNVWIGTIASGVVRYRLHAAQKDDKITFYTQKDGLPSSYIDHIYKFSNGRIWVSSLENGAAQFNPSPGKGSFSAVTVENGLPISGVNSVFMDREGSIWFGTDGGGVAQLRDSRFDIFTENQGLLSNSVWTVFKDSRENLWFGCNQGITGFLKHSKKRINISSYGKDKLKKVIKIIEDNDGNIILLSYELGVFYLDKRKYNIHKLRLPQNFPGNEVVAMEQDEQGNIWLASLYNGLLCYNEHDKKFISFTRKKGLLITDSLYVLYKDKKNNLWIGTQNKGVFRYDGRRIEKSPIPLQSVLGIAEGYANDMWFINQTDQLFRWHDSRLKEFGAARGLKGHTLYSVIADSAGVWVGTSVGMARYMYGDSAFKFFGYREGFPIAETNEGAVYRDKNNQLWFGTIGGAVRYHPKHEKKNKIAPKTAIRSVELFSEKVNIEQKTEYGYDENKLTINFIGISLTVPERVKYRYRLLGLEPRSLQFSGDRLQRRRGLE